VLPNNKNVILAAKQAAQLYEDAKIHIVETKNMIEGYCAMSVITPGIKDMDALVASATRAAKDVTDGEITRAVRDATIDGKEIKAGDYIAISKGEIAAVADTAEHAALALLETADADLCEIITIFVGKDVSNDRRISLTEQLQETYEDCDVIVYDGGQDVYDYFIALE
jgi:dihydroxyacetone kinase-like predicted kinase